MSAGWIKLSGVRLSPGDADLAGAVSLRLGIALSDVIEIKILRRSLDARHRRQPFYEHTLAVKTARALDDYSPWLEEKIILKRPDFFPSQRPVVAGMGPAGLFCALRLVEYGFKPLIIERGKPVEERLADVNRFWKHAELDPESNVQFGEGGAGAFSDGKLTSRSGDFRKSWVLEKLVEHGAREEILYEAKPHIGTDKLRPIIRNIRDFLIKSGAEIKYCEILQAIGIVDKKLQTVVTRNSRYEASQLFLALGHSARDSIASLMNCGVEVEPKPFAVGFRVEIDQDELDRQQYGDWASQLPPAEFALTGKSADGRGVYSFCMCPGGVVIPASSEEGHLVINGMSGSGRASKRANAALVVETGGFSSPSQGFALQREIEAKCASFAGKGCIPAQMVSDFMAGKVGAVARSNSPWELKSANLAELVPDFVASGIRSALPEMLRTLKPLQKGIFLAPETRTSCPVRIKRGHDMQSVSVGGLYPIGEGAGYAGGIISSAIDGAKAVDAFVFTLGGGVMEGKQ